MNFELFVSFRYLLAKRKQTFISLITLISIAGVAVGVMALIVVLAVMNGFQEDLRNRILGVTSHVVVGSYGGTIAKYPELMPLIQKTQGVVAVTPFIYTQVMLSSGKGASGAVLRGIDPQTAAGVLNLQNNMTRGNVDDLAGPRSVPSGEGTNHPGIILGEQLAANLGVHQDDWLTIISPVGRLTPMGQAPKSKLFRVVGIFRSGMHEFDTTIAYVDLATAQQFLGIGDSVTGLEVKVKDVYEARNIAETLRSQLGYPYYVRDWMQMNHSLFSALKLEKVVMFIILTLIVLVAAFNIVSSLIMLVMEKTKDIAILISMGATRRSIRSNVSRLSRSMVHLHKSAPPTGRGVEG